MSGEFSTKNFFTTVALKLALRIPSDLIEEMLNWPPLTSSHREVVDEEIDEEIDEGNENGEADERDEAPGERNITLNISKGNNEIGKEYKYNGDEKMGDNKENINQFDSIVQDKQPHPGNEASAAINPRPQVNIVSKTFSSASDSTADSKSQESTTIDVSHQETSSKRSGPTPSSSAAIWSPGHIKSILEKKPFDYSKSKPIRFAALSFSSTRPAAPTFKFSPEGTRSFVPSMTYVNSPLGPDNNLNGTNIPKFRPNVQIIQSSPSGTFQKFNFSSTTSSHLIPSTNFRNPKVISSQSDVLASNPSSLIGQTDSQSTQPKFRSPPGSNHVSGSEILTNSAAAPTNISATPGSVTRSTNHSPRSATKSILGISPAPPGLAPPGLAPPGLTHPTTSGFSISSVSPPGLSPPTSSALSASTVSPPGLSPPADSATSTSSITPPDLSPLTSTVTPPVSSIPPGLAPPASTPDAAQKSQTASNKSSSELNLKNKTTGSPPSASADSLKSPKPAHSQSSLVFPDNVPQNITRPNWKWPPRLPIISDDRVEQHVYSQTPLYGRSGFHGLAVAVMFHRHNRRLRFLGRTALDFAISALTFERFPYATVEELREWKSKLLSRENIEHWARVYEFHNFVDIELAKEVAQLEHEAPDYDTDPEGKAGFQNKPPPDVTPINDALEAYIGAVFLDPYHGPKTIKSWLKRLTEPTLSGKGEPDNWNESESIDDGKEYEAEDYYCHREDDEDYEYSGVEGIDEDVSEGGSLVLNSENFPSL